MDTLFTKLLTAGNKPKDSQQRDVRSLTQPLDSCSPWRKLPSSCVRPGAQWVGFAPLQTGSLGLKTAVADVVPGQPAVVLVKRLTPKLIAAISTPV